MSDKTPDQNQKRRDKYPLARRQNSPTAPPQGVILAAINAVTRPGIGQVLRHAIPDNIRCRNLANEAKAHRYFAGLAAS